MPSTKKSIEKDAYFVDFSLTTTIKLLSKCTVITFVTYEPIFLAWIQTHVICYLKDWYL